MNIRFEKRNYKHIKEGDDDDEWKRKNGVTHTHTHIFTCTHIQIYKLYNCF